ncbi:hypothetical protein [Microbacterium sp. Marseille-Q6965]|uniref:hypothetical protein n=1 Tax=Microbacterium sp. Marseille-Q6965 TaxID=2965072 RepID=UPI0021B7D628|nr:hypothetical protein [Microbacterium sp. Marseille-Q6965]
MNWLNITLAADQSALGYNPDTGLPDAVIVLAEDGDPALALEPGRALALAARLRVLAQEVIDARGPLRRSADVDERLRELDD